MTKLNRNDHKVNDLGATIVRTVLGVGGLLVAGFGCGKIKNKNINPDADQEEEDVESEQC